MIRKTFLAGFALLLFSIATMTFWAAGRSDVADAAMKGDKAALRTLIQQKADVNATQVDGATALHWAVYHLDAESVDLLIKNGAKVDVKNREGITPLHLASEYGDAKIIDKLIKAGADPKQKGPAGETMLMLAARVGNPDAITVLIAARADVNAREPLRGTTALMWAVEQKHPEAVAALLDGKANFAARSGGAGLPRNYMANRVNAARVEAAVKVRKEAAENGKTYEEQLAADIANGSVTGVRGAGGNAFGGFNRNQQQQQQQQGGAAPTAGAPAGAGQQPGAQAGGRGQGRQGGRGQRGGGQTAGQQGGARNGAAAAAEAGAGEDDDTDVVIAGLVGSGGGGLTPMVIAAREGDLESAKLLLAAGADINQTTEYGWTPLLTATNNRHYKLSEYLIENGADVNKANKGSWTPIYLATDNRNIEGGDFPVPKPDLDHLEYIKFLLDHGANPNIPAKDNTLTRTIFTMQWFLEAGATPFIRAAQSGDLELLKLLLAHGADPKAKTDHNDTALTAASGVGWVEGVTYEHSYKENIEVVKFLLDLGLDANAANNDGRTSLMVAAAKGRPEVIQLLVDHGAKLDTRDKGNRDTETLVSKIAGHTWQALDYADGLVRFGVQSAVARPEAAALIRKLMTEQGMSVPPVNRNVDSICIVEICRERVWNPN
jgi:ankyrin repeat protein